MIGKIVERLESSSYFQNKLAALQRDKQVVFSGLAGSSASAVIAALTNIKRHLVVVVPTTETARTVSAEIELFSGRRVSFCPRPDGTPEVIGRRLEIAANWPRLTVAPIKALLAKTNRHVATKLLRPGDRLDRDKLLGWLADQGYRRFEIVGARGEVAARGGIIDIYSVNFDYAVRLELSGDEIVSLRAFNPYDQRTIRPLENVLIVPARELPEVLFSDHLPADAVLVRLEPLTLEDHLKVDQAVIDLTAFQSPEEKAPFAAPESFLGQLDRLPPSGVIVTKHAARLRNEISNEIVEGTLRGGFVFAGSILLTDKELFGEEFKPPRAKTIKDEGVADELLADLKAGDFVVHENYGIAVYRGQQTLEWEGVKQEYLLLEFAGGDKVYVPPSLAGLVEKYTGAGDYQPRLSHLGTAHWQKTKAKVKKALKDMTKELIALYAARNKIAGIAYPADDIWQKELAGTFPYEETPDQLKAIDEVKLDMEAGKPMDRLVCGDVGYGKTEVAIRAAAKAAAAGKQVAVLVPTTILAEQHYNNFKQRLSSTPFVVEMLSRFRSAAEQKQIVKALAGGGIDIIIGTHRLISKDVAFKDLGLLIIDEEHRFGVGHKEKLKRFKQNVDVITLTATPIPRTLYLSLSGARDMSLINTPPVDRSPIHTYVLPWSEAVVKEAIGRELDRGGQVYFVHNFVESISGMAAKIRKLVPGARVAVGHGQMKERELEKTMLDFMTGKFDVLVCTSIIESGLDIPNVNTILIDQADQLGLAQLYQIRGRVGRSAARAYAYLFYHPARAMTDTALERLKAIQELTALGSGYKLAMKDLEIRGAGNMLGAEQSGHIYEVGFDLYCELLETAVKEVKGISEVSPREVEVDLKVEAFIPADYIEDDRQRLATYRRLNLIKTAKELAELKNELVDRFGAIPNSLARLLSIVDLKVKALAKGIISVRESGGFVQLEWLSGKKQKISIKDGDKIKSARQGIGG